VSKCVRGCDEQANLASELMYEEQLGMDVIFPLIETN
jgi:hypothetical protein